MSGAEDFDIAGLFAAVARDIATQDGVAATTSRIVDLAHKSIGCSAAAIWNLDAVSSKLTIEACTDLNLVTGLRGVKQNGQGVAWQCLTDQATVVVEDFYVDTRWPEYTSWVKANSALRSAVGYSLDIEDRRFGALVLYSTEAGFFSEGLIRAGAIYAAHAAIALESAAFARRAEHLETALKSNRRIGMAIGILMRGNALTEQQAFDLMRSSSQHLHIKLHEVAAYVVETGEALDWRAKSPPDR